MASACGIHIDQRRFHLVALDGSARKHKIVAHATGEIAPGDDPVEGVSRELKRIAKENKLTASDVGLAVDSGLAAFRSLTLPFDDRSKIEEVLKFEVENDLPQWDIDDVVIDFIVLSSKPGVESNLLVTAIPKTRLARQLEACERAGLEASEAELDGTALFNAAHEAGVMGEEAAQILVHVGDSSTTVVVADGGRLFSMRAIRAGALPHLPPQFEEEEEEEASPEDAEDEEERVQERLRQTALRIRRELGRTISAAQTEHPIEAIHVCGHPLEGLQEETLFEVPVVPLEVLPPSGDEVMPQELTIAYGAALRELGGGLLQPRLRREDLRFTGKFERLELPLAVFSLLLFTLLAVQLIVINKQILWRDEGDLAKDWPGDMQIWLQASKVHLLPDATTGWPGRLTDPPEEIVNHLEKSVRGDDEGRTKFGEIREIRRLLIIEVDNLKNELNIGSGEAAQQVPQPLSALEGSTLVMDVIGSLGEDLGRFGIRSLQADYRQGRNSPDEVEVKLDMDFFAEDDLTATVHYNAFKRACESEPWCIEFEERPTKPFPNGGGISVEGISIHVDVTKAQEAS